MRGGKVENCRRIKDGNGGLAQAEDKVQRIWKEYFEDMYNIYSGKGGFDRSWRGNYFGEPIGRAEVEVRIGKLKNKNAAGGDEITVEMIGWWIRYGGYVIWL